MEVRLKLLEEKTFLDKSGVEQEGLKATFEYVHPTIILKARFVLEGDKSQVWGILSNLGLTQVGVVGDVSIKPSGQKTLG